MNGRDTMIVFVAALDENRGIGYGGTLPWSLPADMAHFRQTTMGHAVLMGRKTYESIGKPLPGRENIVLTRDRSLEVPGVKLVHTLEEAVAESRNRELHVIGGAELFQALLPQADKLVLTRIWHAFPADTFFPELSGREWALESSIPGVTDERNPYRYDFEVWARK